MKQISFIKVLLSIALFILLNCTINNLKAQKSDSSLIAATLKKIADAKSDTGKIKLLNQLSLQLSYNEPNQAKYYARMAYSLAKKSNWKKGMAEATRYIGAIMVDENNEDSCLFYLNESYDLYKSINDTEGMITNKYNMGAFQQHLSHYSDAMNSFFEGIELANKSNSKLLMAKGNSLAATVLVQQKDFEKARQYSLKALSIFKILKYVDGQFECLEMLGYGYMMEKRLKEAKPYFMNALQLADSVGNDLVKAKIYTQLVVYSEFGNEPLNRLIYLKDAQAIWDKIAPASLYSIANIANLGSLYLDLYLKPDLLKQMPDSIKNMKPLFLQTATEYVQKAIDLSQQEKNPDLQLQLYQLNSQILEAKGDYKNALENFKSYSTLNDSLFSQQSKNKIAELEANYQFEKKEAVYKAQQKLSSARLRQLWTYAILAIVLLASISFYFLNRTRIKQLRLNSTLQQRDALQKERELTLQNQLTQTELKAIRAQMSPHFIFNVLNSIESYILEQDARTASNLLQKFASLCRLILENSSESVVSLEREWEALILYTELEAIRFGHLFKYSFMKDEKINPATCISPMMVQPLIENAIHHGVRNSDRKNLFINVSVEQIDNTLSFVIKDNGAGLKMDEKEDLVGIKQKSFGIKLIKERLDIMNKTLGKHIAKFSLSDNNNTTVAKLILPIFN